MGSNGVKRGWCYARSNDGRAAKYPACGSPAPKSAST